MTRNQHVEQLSQSFLFALMEILGSEIEQVRTDNKGLSLIDACPSKKYFDSLNLMENCFVELYGSLDPGNLVSQSCMREAWNIVRNNNYSLSANSRLLH